MVSLGGRWNPVPTLRLLNDWNRHFNLPRWLLRCLVSRHSFFVFHFPSTPLAASFPFFHPFSFFFPLSILFFSFSFFLFSFPCPSLHLSVSLSGMLAKLVFIIERRKSLKVAWERAVRLELSISSSRGPRRRRRTLRHLFLPRRGNAPASIH